MRREFSICIDYANHIQGDVVKLKSYKKNSHQPYHVFAFSLESQDFIEFPGKACDSCFIDYLSKKNYKFFVKDKSVFLINLNIGQIEFNKTTIDMIYQLKNL